MSYLNTAAALPQEVDIQPAAQAEIMRLHLDQVDKARAFEEARVAFTEFIRAVRHSLRITDEQPYNIRADASAFYYDPAEPLPEEVR